MMQTHKRKLMLLVLVIGAFGCRPKMPLYTASGEKVLVAQKDVSLFRKDPKIWAARGYVAATKEELIFIPLPHFGIPIHGQDSTFIRLQDIKELQKKKWMLVFPFRLDIITKEGTRYPFVSVDRDRLIRGIKRVKEESE